MARINLLEKEQLPPAFAALAEQAEKEPPFLKASFFQILGHCPEMFEQYLPFYDTWHNGGKVAPIIKEMARLKIARLNNCAICKGARFAVAQHAGLTEEKIAEIENFESSNSFTLQEKMALRFAEKLALNHHSIDDDFMKAMREQFTDPQIVELGMMIAQYLGFGRVLAVLDPEPSLCSLK